MRIYLDNCCLNRPFDDQSKIRIRLEAEAILYIQAKIAEREIEMAWSYIIDYENSFNPYEEKRSAISDMKAYAVMDTDETDTILKTARSVGEQGVRNFDALHIACAVETKCDYFLTTDDLLLSKLKSFERVRVINPVLFVNLLEEKR